MDASVTKGRIERLSLATGARQTIASGLGVVLSLRYDPSSKRLYFVEGDGNLKSVAP